MTKKQINNISYKEALEIYIANNRPLSFVTSSKDVKYFARNHLRQSKKSLSKLH